MKEKNRKITLGDIWGGVTSSSIILPQAMAFGVTFWGLFADDVATGALAGLIGAFALSLMSGLMRGTRGMVSAPTGPTLVLLGGAAITLNNQGLSQEALLASMMVIIFLTGFFQILIALSNSGKIIKYIPFPVVAGFMTGSALLMIMSQHDALFAGEVSSLWQDEYWLPTTTALITFAAMHYIPKKIKAIPGPIAGIIIGTASFYLLNLLLPQTFNGSWLVGELPSLSSIQPSWRLNFDGIPWDLILIASLSLAVLATVDTLLTSVVADTITNSRHNAKRELLGQGMGQILASLLGGLGGAGTTGATLVAIKSGGYRWVAFTASLTFLALLFFVAPFVAYLPISVLAGIIIYVALMSMIERDILAWLKARQTRVDAITAITVTIVTVTFDLMIAVGVGIILAAIQFIRNQMLTSLVHERVTVTKRTSLRRRNEKESQLLADHGDRIVLYKLQGDLFFGSADQLYEVMKDDLTRPVWLILDMGRVDQVDLTALRMLQHMSRLLSQHGGKLIFSRVYKVRGISKKVTSALRKVSPRYNNNEIKSFIDTDEALEYAEDALLTKLGEASVEKDVGITHDKVSLFSKLTPEQHKKVMKYFHSKTMQKGEMLFQRGDIGDQIYLVMRGEVDALLPYGKGFYRRVAAFGPGTFLGEVSFLEKGKRTTDARVAREADLLYIDHESFSKLRHEDPEVAIEMLKALGKSLSRHLTFADKQLRRLSE